MAVMQIEVPLDLRRVLKAYADVHAITVDEAVRQLVMVALSKPSDDPLDVLAARVAVLIEKVGVLEDRMEAVESAVRTPRPKPERNTAPVPSALRTAAKEPQPRFLAVPEPKAPLPTDPIEAFSVVFKLPLDEMRRVQAELGTPEETLLRYCRWWVKGSAGVEMGLDRFTAGLRATGDNSKLKPLAKALGMYPNQLRTHIRRRDLSVDTVLEVYAKRPDIKTLAALLEAIREDPDAKP